MLSFAHLWQQAELSDVDVLLTSPFSTDQGSDALLQKLTEFPGHTVLLSSSPYLKAQVRFGVHLRHTQDMLDLYQATRLLGNVKDASLCLGVVLGPMWPGCD
jgi:hypothetical protein